MLSEKIIALRRKNGWSQEELADKLDVSRQAVSKWEGAQSTPDVERIVQLAELFNVSTDYLLREGEAPIEEAALPQEDVAPVKAAASEIASRKVSMEEAKDFLEICWSNSRRIALGVWMCVFSPVCLIALAGAAEEHLIAEGVALAIGLTVLLSLVAAAVALFVFSGFRSHPYEYLEKEYIEIDGATREMVEERRVDYRPSYIRGNIVAACLCVLSPVSIFLGLMWEEDFLMLLMVCCTLILAGTGAALFVVGGVKWQGTQILLQEGEYTPFEKRANVLREKIAPVYWIAAAAIYLAWSFASGEWDETWIIWPVAGVVFAGISVVCGIIQKNREERA